MTIHNHLQLHNFHMYFNVLFTEKYDNSHHLIILEVTNSFEVEESLLIYSYGIFLKFVLSHVEVTINNLITE